MDFNIYYIYHTHWHAPWPPKSQNIQSDKRLNGQFEYEAVCHEGGERAHIGHWDSAETLAYLQRQDFFKTFSEHVKEFVGDTLYPKRFLTKAKTWSDSLLNIKNV